MATIDYTYFVDAVEFPGGRVEQQFPPPGDAIVQREQYARFVLDELTAIDHGQNPDAEHHRLPQGLRGALDLNRVGMVGHSADGPPQPRTWSTTRGSKPASTWTAR